MSDVEVVVKVPSGDDTSRFAAEAMKTRQLGLIVGSFAFIFVLFLFLFFVGDGGEGSMQDAAGQRRLATSPVPLYALNGAIPRGSVFTVLQSDDQQAMVQYGESVAWVSWEVLRANSKNTGSSRLLLIAIIAAGILVVWWFRIRRRFHGLMRKAQGW